MCVWAFGRTFCSAHGFLTLPLSSLLVDSLSAGFLLTKNNIPDYWIWLYYISFVRYPLESLTINQVLPLTYTCGNITSGDYAGVLVNITTSIDGHGTVSSLDLSTSPPHSCFVSMSE
jgi:ABC-2 type transporter